MSPLRIEPTPAGERCLLRAAGDPRGIQPRAAATRASSVVRESPNALRDTSEPAVGPDSQRQAPRDVEQIARDDLPLDPRRHERLELAQAVAGQRRGDPSPELLVLPELDLAQASERLSEASIVEVLAAHLDEEVVGNDLPAAADRLERVAQRRVDPPARERPPADLVAGDLDPAMLGVQDRAHRPRDASRGRRRPARRGTGTARRPRSVCRMRWQISKPRNCGRKPPQVGCLPRGADRRPRVDRRAEPGSRPSRGRRAGSC